jgi:hypothetical protein
MWSFQVGRRLSVWLAALMLLPGCGFHTLKKDLEESRQQATLEGHAEVRGAERAAVVVVVYSISSKQVADLFLLPRSGPFFFVLPAGAYRLAAFEDRNHDLSYQPGEEPAVLFKDGAALVLRSGEHETGVDLAIDPASVARIPFAVSGLSAERRESIGFLRCNSAPSSISTIRVSPMRIANSGCGSR